MQNTEIDSNLFVSSIKNTLKAKYPNTRIKQPVLEVLSECSLKFAQLITSASAKVCDENNTHLMTCTHVNKAIKEMGYGHMVPKLTEVASKLESDQKAASQEKNLKKKKCTLSQEEQIALFNKLRREAIDENRKQQE